METNGINDLHIGKYEKIISPNDLAAQFQLSKYARSTVTNGRSVVRSILDGKDERTLLVVGPCSIHNVKQAKEYASKLNSLREKVKDVFYVIMRTYLSKPRSGLGWNGLITDPNLDYSFDIEKGLRLSRELLIHINELGLPCAAEIVDSLTPQFISDCLSYVAVGARTTESQIHKEMASGLSMPVGFKNSTSGSVDVAINAVISARGARAFLGIDKDGRLARVGTIGNNYGHIILRGGDGGPNYDSENIKEVRGKIHNSGIETKLVVDCSHGNSEKDHTKQPEVFRNVIEQIKNGNSGIVGIMLESNLKPGNQSIDTNRLHELKYGVSITDKCLGWEQTEEVILDGYEKLKDEKIN